jgi:circadian clock protein KaiC
VLGTHFIAEGIAHGESCVAAVFEEHPDDYLARAMDMGFDLPAMMAAGKLELLQLRPLDLSSDEVLFRIQEAVRRIGARRLVIDSLNGLEIALAPTFRDDFRESFYRMISSLTGCGISVVLTIEVPEVFTEITFSPHAVSFLSQNIIFLRYVELESELRRMITIVKMRRSSHTHAFHEYEITASGLRMLGPLTNYRGLLSGSPTAAGPPRTRR